MFGAFQLDLLVFINCFLASTQLNIKQRLFQRSHKNVAKLLYILFKETAFSPRFCSIHYTDALLFKYYQTITLGSSALYWLSKWGPAIHLKLLAEMVDYTIWLFTHTKRRIMIRQDKMNVWHTRPYYNHGVSKREIPSKAFAQFNRWYLYQEL